MKNLLSILFFVICSVSVYADGIDSLFVADAPQQEKVYLHLDNNWYFTGDTIYYKAYVVDAATYKPSNMSRVLYVELLNEQGYLVERQMIGLGIKGHSQGAFCVSDTAFAGYYEVRAYTKWMMNFGWEAVPKYPYREYERMTIASYGLKSWKRDYSARMLRKQIDLENQSKNGTVDLDGQAERVKQAYKNDPSIIDINKTTITNEFDDSNYAYSSSEIYDLETNGLGDYRNGFAIFPDAQIKRYRTYDGLFSRIIPIYQRPDSVQNYKRKNMPVKLTMGEYNKVYTVKDINLNFYPEGGHLVEDHLSRVGWEARDAEGRRMNLRGVLMEDDIVIDSIKPVHAGRGDFRFLPRKGHKYKVIVKCGDKTFKPNLPKVEKVGVTLFVDRRGDDITFQVGKTLEDNRLLYLSLLSGGKALQVFSLEFANGDALVKVPVKDLPAGVIQATIFDELEQVFSDRLFFVDSFDEAVLSASVKGKQHDVEPYEKVTLSVNIADKDGFPLPNQTFSVSVRDGGQMDESYYNGNILSDLLLQSELRGFVENPDYYFRKTNGIDEVQRRHALDNLMLIQGWRRYDWTNIAHSNEWKPEYNAEYYPTISGDVAVIRNSLLRNNHKRPLKVFCGIRAYDPETGEQDLKVTCQPCDSTGHFSFAYNPFYGNGTITLRAQYGDYKKPRSEQEHDPSLFVKRDHFFPNFVRPLDWFEINKPDCLFTDPLNWMKYEEESYLGRLLDNVTVKAKHRKHVNRRMDLPVYKVDALEVINTIQDMGYYDNFYKTDIDEFNLSLFCHEVQSLFTGRFTSRPTEISEIRWNNHSTRSGGDRDWGQAYKYWSALDTIAVVTDDPLRASPYYLHHLTALPTFGGEPLSLSKYILFTAHSNSEKAWEGRLYREKGFCQPVDFYNPDYSKIPLPEQPDTRHTLFWAPNITTDANGRARITFYNNAVCKDLDVDVQGITNEGKFIVK